MHRNGIKQQDMTSELGSIGGVSLILSGKRNLTTRHIQALSAWFNLPSSAFLAAEPRARSSAARG